MNSDYHLPIPKGGFFSRQQCQNLVRKIMDIYDHNRDGLIDAIQVGQMLCDCYRSMNKSFMPTATDIAEYCRVFNKSNRGKVSKQDIQEFVIQNFHSPN